MASEGGGCESGSQQAERCFLRVEAVNLGNCVYDTNDISTIRGGGFLILNAVTKLSGEKFLKHISTGASAGIFEVVSGTGEEAREKALEVVNKATGGHATFVADWFSTPETEGKGWFKTVQETLMARNRFRQFQELTVPWRGVWDEAEGPCHYNGVLPGVHKRVPPGETVEKPVSASAVFRREGAEAGKSLRQTIYANILKNLDAPRLPKFTNNLEELGESKEQGNLGGKIAYIYIDGNKFSGIREDYVSEPCDLTNFDQAVQEKFRAKVLLDVIRHMSADPSSQTAGGLVRLETLLWGGDELEWVVPAWKGWEILQMFYKEQPFLPAKEDGAEPIPLTHAAGVVFCHHTAPILEIRQMAHALAEMAKDTLDKNKLPARETGDIFHYLVLESLDRTEADLSAFLKDYYKPVEFSELVVRGGQMEDFAKAMKALKENFPRNKVFKIVEKLKSGLPAESESVLIDALAGLSAAKRSSCEDAIHFICRGNPNRWFVIADLWDYLGGEQ